MRGIYQGRMHTTYAFLAAIAAPAALSAAQRYEYAPEHDQPQHLIPGLTSHLSMCISIIVSCLASRFFSALSNSSSVLHSRPLLPPTTSGSAWYLQGWMS